MHQNKHLDSKGKHEHQTGHHPGIDFIVAKFPWLINLQFLQCPDQFPLIEIIIQKLFHLLDISFKKSVMGKQMKWKHDNDEEGDQ